ncbi:MAG TPA: DarT ssDNA thymidine ADP-ribosyltransferase family protein [Dehalococcoidia bacterium]|nr:DarT ssDNA thymidine ADP-ribosyltransferase family protein [Dehalococcoidia bacterium]
MRSDPAMRLPAFIQNLYYITHINNLPSILRRGILCHERVINERIPYSPIYDEEIMALRRAKVAPDGRSLWTFVNLYFNARNAMLYRVIVECGTDNLAVLAIRRDVVEREGVFISDGNAAHQESRILPKLDGLRAISNIKGILERPWWASADGSKRRMMAECLIPDVVEPTNIVCVYVASNNVLTHVKTLLQREGVPIPRIVPEPNMFFAPVYRRQLTDVLSLVKGDMFFSRCHTLTVSVNCVGVMGKGLASTAKYRFPEVYVYYQDRCRSGELKLGRPVLYRREVSIDADLADEPSRLTNGHTETWFLLFPTKHHWRERANIDAIKSGLDWIVANYKQEGIKSLAVPALGCGEGWLDWKDVGPILCKSLSRLDIPVEVYLPAEKEVPEDQRSREFLLDD